MRRNILSFFKNNLTYNITNRNIRTIRKPTQRNKQTNCPLEKIINNTGYIYKTSCLTNNYIVKSSINNLYIQDKVYYPNNYSIRIFNNTNSNVHLSTNSIPMYSMLYNPTGSSDYLMMPFSSIILIYFIDKWSVHAH
jgi:hypothetical protein